MKNLLSRCEQGLTLLYIGYCVLEVLALRAAWEFSEDHRITRKRVCNLKAYRKPEERV